jgi:hypothetical protein
MTETQQLSLAASVIHYAQTHLDVNVDDIVKAVHCDPSEARHELEELARDGYITRTDDVYVWGEL